MELESWVYMPEADKPYIAYPQYRQDGRIDPTKPTTYELTLSPQFLTQIRDPRCPISHLFVEETWDGEMSLQQRRDQEVPSINYRLRDYPAIHNIVPRHILNVQSELYAPFFARLESHPGLNSGGIRSQWKSRTPPHYFAYWKSEETLYQPLDSGLVRPVQALLDLLPLPPASRLVIVSQTDTKDYLEGKRTQAHRSDYYCVTVVDGNGRVLLVIEVKPWLDRETMKALRDTASAPQFYLFNSASDEERRMHTVKYAILQQLAHQMRVANAPLGAIYNGSDLIVFERDFDYDLATLNQAMAAALGGPPLPSDFRHDLVLRSWDVGFSHPFDHNPPRAEERFDQSANAVVCIAALVYLAYQRYQTRPHALRESNIDRYYSKNARGGRCHCSASRAVSAAGVSPADDSQLREKLPTSDILPAFEDMMKELALASASQSEQTRLLDDHDALVSFGQYQSPLGPCIYFLACPAERPRQGAHALVYPGILHVVNLTSKLGEIEPSPLASLTSALLRITCAEADSSAPIERPEHQHLYRTRQHVVSTILRKYEEVTFNANRGSPRVGAAEMRSYRVVLKLPNVAGCAVSSTSVASSSSGKREQRHWFCSRGMCDVAACILPSDHTPVQSRLAAVLAAQKREMQAYARLSQGGSRAGNDDVSAVPAPAWTTRGRAAPDMSLEHLLSLRLTSALPTHLLEERWPGLGLAAFFDCAYHVFTDAGPTLQDLLRYDKSSPLRVQSAESDHVIFHLQSCPDDLARIREQAQHQLSDLHAAGIIHGDVHPGNICLRLEQACAGARYKSGYGIGRVDGGEGSRSPTHVRLLGQSDQQCFQADSGDGQAASTWRPADSPFGSSVSMRTAQSHFRSLSSSSISTSSAPGSQPSTPSSSFPGHPCDTAVPMLGSPRKGQEGVCHGSAFEHMAVPTVPRDHCDCSTSDDGGHDVSTCPAVMPARLATVVTLIDLGSSVVFDPPSIKFCGHTATGVGAGPSPAETTERQGDWAKHMAQGDLIRLNAAFDALERRVSRRA